CLCRRRNERRKLDPRLRSRLRRHAGTADPPVSRVAAVRPHRRVGWRHDLTWRWWISLPRGRIHVVKIDLLFAPFGATWTDVQSGAVAAEGEGFDGVWVYDHLAGSVHGQDRVLESWTTLTAIAATVPRIAIGPMVLNVANRDAGTLGVMAATLQEISEGRLLLGLGAGGGWDTPYAAEQVAFGRPVPADAVRRSAVESTVTTLRSVL